MGEATDEERAQGGARRRGNGPESGRYLAAGQHRLVELFASLLQSKPVQQIRREAEAIKVAFYKLHRAENEQKRREFTEARRCTGRFRTAARCRRSTPQGAVRRIPQAQGGVSGQHRKGEGGEPPHETQIIEELKELVNGNETMNSTFNAFRELQQRWRETGIVSRRTSRSCGRPTTCT